MIAKNAAQGLKGLIDSDDHQYQQKKRGGRGRKVFSVIFSFGGE